MGDPSLGVDASRPKRSRLDSSLNIVLLVALVAVVAVVGIFGYTVWVDRQERSKASPALRTIAELEAQVRKAPNNVAVHVRLGEAYAAAGMTTKAVGQLQAATKLDPKHTGAWLDLGLISMDQKRLAEAKGYFGKVVDLTTGTEYQDVNNRRENALYGLGLVALESKQYEDAVGFFKEALRIRDDASDTYYHLALAYRGLGEDDAALDQLELALAFDPTYPAGNYLMAEIYLAKKDPVNASYHLYKAFQMAPESAQVKSALKKFGSAESWFAKAEAQIKSGNAAQAVDSIIVARNLDPQKAAYAKLHGAILVARKQNKDALDVYLQASDLDPGDDAVKSQIARLNRVVSKKDALEVYLKAAGRNPSNKSVKAQVDRLTKALPRSVALAVYKELSKTDSANVAVMEGLKKLQGAAK